MKRTGVFVCHCGINIAGTVDVKKVAKELAGHHGVAHAEDYVYMCSDPGQNADHPGHQGQEARQRGRLLLLAQPAREDLPRTRPSGPG